MERNAAFLEITESEDKDTRTVRQQTDVSITKGVGSIAVWGE